MKKLNWSAVFRRLVLFVAAGFIATVCGPEITVAAAATSVQSTYFAQEETPVPVPVPEPSGFALFGSGVLALAGVLRWRFNQAESRKLGSQKQSWLGKKPEEMQEASKPPQPVTNARPQVERGRPVGISAKGTAA